MNGMKAGHPQRSHRNGHVSTAHLTNSSEHGLKGPGGDWFKDGRQGQDACADGLKRPGITISQGFNNWPKDENGAYILPDGTKCGGDWFNNLQPSISRLTSSRSLARKAASAQIAKIPLPLAEHIARVYHPQTKV